MSQYAESSYPESLYSVPLPQRSQFAAEESAVEVIEKIIERVIYRITRNEKFRENLRKFSNMKTIKNIDEVNSLNFYESLMESTELPLMQQPRPLYIDSLLPISADLDKENTYKTRLKGMIESQVSEISRTRRQVPIKKDKKDEYLKLDFETKGDEQDGFTKELRKMQQDKESKQRLNQKTKELLDKEEREKLKEKKKEREERFSFDYSGTPIKIRLESKSNLISKLINGNMNSKTLLNKEAINDPNPQVVDSVVLSKKKSQSNATIKKRDEVQFQENRTLAEGVKVGVGIRYSYDGKTLEAKHKAVSTFQLKKTIKDRRLNRQEFERVRSLNGSSLQLLNSEADFRETKHKRSQSEVKLLKQKKKQVQTERITINNNNLREKMLQKVNEMMEQRNFEETNPSKKFQYVGQTDIFNMNYLKNGKEGKTDKNLESLSTQRSLMLLPKIGKPREDKNLLPKERERIKQINTIIYSIRKKFDEKLKF